jgi:predicted outer membrane repeat protein
MKGGIIQNNISRGIGAIEGFDGRGGAVYNQGTVVISDGLLRENCAIGFQTKKTRYGGAGGMLYNEGRCVIAGGTIEKNVSSYGGGAIYSSTGSVLRITDGNFQGNQAEVGGTIFFCGKSCYLNLQLNEKEFYNATTKKTERTGKKPQNPSEPVEKKNADSAKTKKKKTLVWKWDKKKRIYYTGEYLTAKLFKYGIRATADGKDMTGYISLSRISGVLDKVSAPHGSFSASAAGNGILHFQIRGYSQELSVPYEIRKNHEVNIRIAPRYLFLWEVADCSLKRWKELVREGIVIEEKEDRAEQLWSRATIDYGAARSGKAGTYTIKISLRDQWGHRFYMKRGLYKRYGAGKIVCAEVPLTLVSLNDSEETEFGVVQFLPEYEQTEEVVEVWTFSSSELIQIGNYTEQAEDPFSENTNIGFLNLWEGNRNSLAEGG